MSQNPSELPLDSGVGNFLCPDCLCTVFYQILLLDGEAVKENPVDVMNEVQKFLGLDPILDYSTMLK